MSVTSRQYRSHGTRVGSFETRDSRPETRDPRLETRNPILVTLLTTLALLFPSTALACPVCFSAKEGTRIAFLVTTGLLSFLPLILIGAFIWWIRRRVREMDASDSSAHQA